MYAEPLLSVNVDSSYPGTVIISPRTNVVVIIQSGSKPSKKFNIQLPRITSNTKFIHIKNLLPSTILITTYNDKFDGQIGVRHVEGITSRSFSFVYSVASWCTIN